MTSQAEKYIFNLYLAVRNYLSCIAISLFLSFQCYAKEAPIKIGVFSDQLPLLVELTQQDKCPPVVPNLIGENQMLLEYLIICNLVQDAKQQFELELVGYPVVPRLVSAIVAGEIDISGFGIWKNESQLDGVVHSEPLLGIGEFSKGLYVTAETKAAIKGKLGEELKSLIAVSNRNWSYDWQLLNCEFTKVMHIDRYQQMFQMLALNRADILPLAFGSNQNMTREEFGIRLYPIEGIKLAFPDSSHILIAQKSPKAKHLQAQINKKLMVFRSNQQLHGWYTESGVIQPKVKKWRSLCNM